MTLDDVLRRVAELDAKATKGPWEQDRHSGWINTVKPVYCASPMHVADIRGWGHLTGVGAANMPHAEAVKIQEANGDIIAEARTLLPQLAEMVRVAREGLEDIVREQDEQGNAGPAIRALAAMELESQGT